MITLFSLFDSLSPSCFFLYASLFDSLCLIPHLLRCAEKDCSESQGVSQPVHLQTPWVYRLWHSGEMLLGGEGGRLCLCTVNQITVKTPDPECRLYSCLIVAQRWEMLLGGEGGRLCLCTVNQITIKTPKPKCRLYWCLNAVGWRGGKALPVYSQPNNYKDTRP
jgi:hypothetical protein